MTTDHPIPEDFTIVTTTVVALIEGKRKPDGLALAKVEALLSNAQDALQHTMMDALVEAGLPVLGVTGRTAITVNDQRALEFFARMAASPTMQHSERTPQATEEQGERKVSEN